MRDTPVDETTEVDGTIYTLHTHPHYDRGTRMFFTKPYHWAKDQTGRLVLLQGPDPSVEGELRRMIEQETA